MKKLDLLLERYKGLKIKDSELKQALIDLIALKTNLTLDPKQIIVNAFQVKIKTTPIEKGEILIHKKVLLKELLKFKIVGLS
jgi:hypothetical protein